MTYQDWTLRYGGAILEHGPRRAALYANVPESYGKRHAEEAAKRAQIAKSMGAPSEFYIPPRKKR